MKNPNEPYEYTVRDAIKLLAKIKQRSTDDILKMNWMKANGQLSNYFQNERRKAEQHKGKNENPGWL